MKKKLPKYEIGGDGRFTPALDARTRAQKMAWENVPIQNNFPFIDISQYKQAGSDNDELAPPMSEEELWRQKYPNAPVNESTTPGMTISPKPQDWETQKLGDLKYSEGRGTGIYDIHPIFQGINTAAIAATGIANAISDTRTTRTERKNYYNSLRGRYMDSNPVLNNQPMFAKYGLAKMPDGGSARKGNVKTIEIDIPNENNTLKTWAVDLSNPSQIQTPNGVINQYNAVNSRGDRMTLNQQQLAAYTNNLNIHNNAAITTYPSTGKPIVDSLYQAPTASLFPPKFAFGGNPEGTSVDNNLRSEWNNYVGWLKEKNLSGSPELDKQGRGLQLLQEYRKTNPNTTLTPEVITPIQQDFQRYRNWVIEQHKQGKAQMQGDPGPNYQNFMPELSTVDGYPGSKTTAHLFPSAYMNSVDGDGQPVKTDRGLIDTTGIVKMPYGGGPLTADGAKEILRDGKVRGRKLTDKQKKYFGYIAGGGKPKAQYGIDEDLVEMASGGDPMKARRAAGFKILRDGEVNGKKLSDKQKKFFAAMAFSKSNKKAQYGVDTDNDASGGKDVDLDADDMSGIIKISDQAPTHENGGVNINNQVEVEKGEAVSVQNGQVDRVLENTSTERKDWASKALKITPDKFESLFGFKTDKGSLSHADALDEATKQYDKKRKKLEINLSKGADLLKRNPHDVYANNSVELNMQSAPTIPTRDDVFNLLFQHQENLKDMLGIDVQAAKYGKYIPKAGTGYDPNDVVPYEGGKTTAGSTTPTGKNNKYDRGNEYLKKWESIIPGVSTWDNKKAQAAIYDHMVNTNPDAVINMWKTYGLTKKGLDNFQTGNKDDGKSWADKKGVIHSSVLDPSKADDVQENLKSLKNAYVDGFFGARQLDPEAAGVPVEDNPEPPSTPSDYIIPDDVPAGTTPDAGFKLRPSQKASRFNEPLRWFDTASSLMSLADSGRIPVTQNPAEISDYNAKLLNPTPALEAGNRDYNAALSTLPNTGAGMANVTQAYANKYSLDNQVLSQYENMNVPIINAKSAYTANVRDRQQLSDQQTRSVAEQQQLLGMEAQRQQRLKSFDELFNRVAQNRKLNREGDLIMQMFPNYDSYGRYNGNQRYFVPGGGGGGASASGYTTEYVPDEKGGQFRIMKDANGKIVSSSKVITDKKKVGSKS